MYIYWIRLITVVMGNLNWFEVKLRGIFVKFLSKLSTCFRESFYSERINLDSEQNSSISQVQLHSNCKHNWISKPLIMIVDHLFLCNSQMSTKNVFLPALLFPIRCCFPEKANKLFMIESHPLAGWKRFFQLSDARLKTIDNWKTF